MILEKTPFSLLICDFVKERTKCLAGGNVWRAPHPVSVQFGERGRQRQGTAWVDQRRDLVPIGEGRGNFLQPGEIAVHAVPGLGPVQGFAGVREQLHQHPDAPEAGGGGRGVSCTCDVAGNPHKQTNKTSLILGDREGF